MATQPVLTIRDVVSPFIALTQISYVQSAPGGNNLPVLQGQTSNAVLFRLYNNFALAAGIAMAQDIHITVFDGSGVGSHTCAFLPVSQSWVHLQEYGYGENSITSPDFFTYYLGTETPIGGNAPCGVNVYTPEYGSDGTTSPRIRAYSNQNGAGFIEFQTVAKLPTVGVLNTSYTFSISVSYEWFS